MDLNFLMEYKTWPRWKVLQGELLRNQVKGYQNCFNNLGYYDLVEVAIDTNGLPLRTDEAASGISFYSIFSNLNLTRRMVELNAWENVQNNIFEGSKTLLTKTIMLGELVSDLKDQKKPATIKINPLRTVSTSGDEFYLAEEMIFAPIFDQFTNKLMITDPEEARALLAVNPEDEERIGINFVFYMITNKDLPNEREEREPLLQDKIKELAFMAPRIPMKKGSGTFLCVILNLENEMEESAFIRTYKTFDPYADVLFVNSSLEIRTGDLIKVPYNGDKIDTIFLPMIEWQKSCQQSRHREFRSF